MSRVSTCYSSAMFSILKKKIKTFLFFRGHGNESCGLITISSLKNCSVKGRSCLNYCLKSIGFLWQKCCLVLEKNENVTQQTRSVRIGKNCALGLEPWAVLKPSGTQLVNNIYS